MYQRYLKSRAGSVSQSEKPDQDPHHWFTVNMENLLQPAHILLYSTPCQPSVWCIQWFVPIHYSYNMLPGMNAAFGGVLKTQGMKCVGPSWGWACASGWMRVRRRGQVGLDLHVECIKYMRRLSYCIRGTWWLYKVVVDGRLIFVVHVWQHSNGAPTC